MNKNIKATAIALALVGTLATAGIVGATKVFAASDTSTSHRDSLIQKIAAKFNINQSEVQAVFDEHKNEMQAQRQAEYETRLTQLVSEGNLTDAQKQLLLAKHKELQTQREANRETMQNLTQEERKAKMQAERTALESWAKENNIDMQYLMLGRGSRSGNRPQ